MNRHPLEPSTHDGTSVRLIDKNVELFLKIAALVLAMGILIGKLNAIDERMGRVERFLDAHITFQNKP